MTTAATAMTGMRCCHQSWRSKSRARLWYLLVSSMRLSDRDDTALSLSPRSSMSWMLSATTRRASVSSVFTFSSRVPAKLLAPLLPLLLLLLPKAPGDASGTGDTGTALLVLLLVLRWTTTDSAAVVPAGGV